MIVHAHDYFSTFIPTKDRAVKKCNETGACLNREGKAPSFEHFYICKEKSGLYSFTSVFEPQHRRLLSQSTAKFKYGKKQGSLIA